jgi:hypothetical protein
MPTPTYVLMADLSSLVILLPRMRSQINVIESEIRHLRQDRRGQNRV